MYAQRQAVERAFSRLKGQRSLNHITVRGRWKVTAHCYLSLIAMQACYHTLMHPLHGPLLKVGRAESQIKALDDLQLSLWSDTPYKVVRAEFNPKTGKDVYRVRTDNPPTFDDWSVSVGEIAHNLRSALDGLVYQLALLKTDTPTRSQFPIFLHGTTKKRLPRGGLIPHFESKARGCGRYMVSELFGEHQAIIERLQPYKRGRGGQNSPLFLLRYPQKVCKQSGGVPSL